VVCFALVDEAVVAVVVEKVILNSLLQEVAVLLEVAVVELHEEMMDQLVGVTGASSQIPQDSFPFDSFVSFWLDFDLCC